LIRGSPVPQLFVPRKTLRNNSRVIKKQPQFPIFNSPVLLRFGEPLGVTTFPAAFRRVDLV